MITSGKIGPNQPLPSIKTLAQEYEVAKGTTEKALGVLRAEGANTNRARPVHLRSREVRLSQVPAKG
jgi:DNA-binding transcriptional MocR family regulator